MSDIKVTLRKKLISQGKKQSLYLDYYPPISLANGKTTRREFLGMYLFTRPTNPIDREHNKETLKTAKSIHASRVLQLQAGKSGFVGSQAKKTNFITYFEKHAQAEKLKYGKAGNLTGTFKHLRLFKPEGITVSDVSTQFCENFKTYLENSNLGQNSKATYFRQFKGVLKIAVKERLFSYNPAEHISNPKTKDPEIEYLTKGEFDRLKETECKSELLRKYFLFGCYTGLRHSDIMSLKWSHIKKDNDGLVISKVMVKTKKPVYVNLSSQALELIGERKERDENVFEKLPLSKHLSATLSTWVKDAQINKHITFHCSRHTFATALLTAGVDIYTVSKLLGHSSVKMTEKYAKVINKKRSQAIKKLENFF